MNQAAEDKDPAVCLKREGNGSEVCVPLSLFLQTDFIHMVVKTGGVTLKSHPSGSLERSCTPTLVCTDQKDPSLLGMMLWRQSCCNFPKCAVLATQPASTSDGSDPNRESIALCPAELWLPYSPCCRPHASRERGQLSSQSQRETLLGNSPEGPPALAGSRAIGSWATL